MTRFKWGKAMKMLIAALMVCLLSVLSFAVYNTYDAYTQMMIAQQQQHLLITARAASQNLSLRADPERGDFDPDSRVSESVPHILCEWGAKGAEGAHTVLYALPKSGDLPDLSTGSKRK